MRTDIRRSLVVDDDRRVASVLGRALDAIGWSSWVHVEGRAALLTFRAELEAGRPIALVITDLEMPGLTGLEVAAEIQALAPNTIVILHTGRGDRLPSGGALPPGVDYVLAKPAKLAEIRQILTRFFGPDACAPSKQGP